jgi:hypothetical protein
MSYVTSYVFGVLKRTIQYEIPVDSFFSLEVTICPESAPYRKTQHQNARQGDPLKLGSPRVIYRSAADVL